VQQQRGKTIDEISDITFIGAGPTGLFGAFYAGLREMRVRIVDALEEPGGQITAMYPEKWIYDVPGFPKIRGKALVENLVAQTEPFQPRWHLDERATTLERADRDGEVIWALSTDKGTYLTRAVVICGGVGAFAPRKLRTVDVGPYEGRGVVYFAKRFEDFRDKRVLIVGGGDSALDWALALEEIAASITLIHRRDRFRAHEASVQQLQRSAVDVRVFHELKALRGDSWVSGATIFDNQTKDETNLDVDMVILALGFIANLGPLKEWGIELSGKRYLRVDAQMRTNLPQVYAAGDIAAVPNLDPLNLIVVGYAQATIAANYAYVDIHPEAKVFPGHSSER